MHGLDLEIQAHRLCVMTSASVSKTPQAMTNMGNPLWTEIEFTVV